MGQSTGQAVGLASVHEKFEGIGTPVGTGQPIRETEGAGEHQLEY